MSNDTQRKRIYNAITEILSQGPATRRQLIEGALLRFHLSREELADTTTGSRMNILRSRCGSILSELFNKEVIRRDEEGYYTLARTRPVIIREEKCEELVLKLLTERPYERRELRDHLVRLFGTDKTATTYDDSRLYTVIGQVLTRLHAGGQITEKNGIYALSDSLAAKAGDVQSESALRSAFLSALYAQGGEFFEHYFMTLLEKYIKRHGKTVTKNVTTGSSEDGGIDGILYSTDALGFREVTMVQTKNRLSTVNERDLRGFYGAVCARQGSRGIFATTATFHEGAKKFMDSLDDCVGIDGYRIFEMAKETGYGIKKAADALTVDHKLFPKSV